MASLISYLCTDFTVLLTTAVIIIYGFFKWSYQYWKRRNVPSLEPTIPFGNMVNPLTSKISFNDGVTNLYFQAKKKGLKHCGIYMMAMPAYMVLDLDLVKNVMTKDFDHFVDRGVYVNEKDDPIGCHLFALGGTKWKNLRAKLSPTFTSGKMRSMFQTMVDCGVILEKYIQEDIADKQVVDIKDVLGRFSTDVIGSCAFGLECNSFKEPNNPFRVFGKKVLIASPLDLIKLFFALNFPAAGRALGIRQVKKDISDFYTKVVEDTISYREKNKVIRNDFMQLLMNMKSDKDSSDGNTLTMNEIVAQSFVFFIAGFETSSTTMTFALYELSRNQDIQDKVREEIRTVLARHDNKITYDSMNELVYMKQVIDETLRLYAPLGILTRKCIEDYKVPGEDTVIEKGTVVFIAATGIHTDEDNYENPDIFDPDRFSTENRMGRHPYAHLPFGAGPRLCIGERFGILQSKVGLTAMLRNFKISLNERTQVPVKMDPKATVTSALGGIWLNVEKV